MRHSTPVVVIMMVTGWILAQGLDRPLWAAVVATLCLGATCSDAMRRRAPARLPVVGLITILAVLAGTMVLLLSMSRDGGGRLLIQLLLVAVLAPSVPLLYALTFGTKEVDE